MVMPDAMGLPPGFMGLLALAIGFPRTCGQKGWLSLERVTPGDMERTKKKRERAVEKTKQREGKRGKGD